MFTPYFFSILQFGGQEPGTHEQIIESVKAIDPTAPEKLVFFEKADVNGANARAVFSFLKRELPNSDGTSDIRWNFGRSLSFCSDRYWWRQPFSHCDDYFLSKRENFW